MKRVQTKLEDAIELFDNKRVPLNSRQRAERQGPYPYYGAQGVIDHINNYIFDGRYLLVPEDGENLNSRKLPIAFFATGRFWVNNHAHILRGREGIADDQFLKHAINATDIAGYVTGAAQPKLSQENLKRIKIWLPKIDVQRRIAGILSAYDDLIRVNMRRIAILEEMGRSLFDEWFVKLRFPGHERASFANTSIGQLPENWTVISPDELADISYGFAFKSAGFNSTQAGRPIIRIRDIKSELSETYTEETADPKYLVRDEDILIGMDGEFHMAIWSGGEAWVNQRVARVRANPGIPPDFLFHLLHAPIKRLEASIVGTTVAHLSARDMREMLLPSPARSILEQCVPALTSWLHERILLRKTNRILFASRELLLPKLISGEIDLPGAERAMESTADQVAAE